METISKLLDITLMAGLTSLGEKILVILNSISSKHMMLNILWVLLLT